MADSTGNALKELLRDPQSYVIAVILYVGGNLMNRKALGATWYVGLFILAFGLVSFIAKFVQSLFEGNFKRKYTEVISAQSDAIKNQSLIISELSKDTIAAHSTMSTLSQSKLSGNYVKDEENITQTS